MTYHMTDEFLQRQEDRILAKVKDCSREDLLKKVMCLSGMIQGMIGACYHMGLNEVGMKSLEDCFEDAVNEVAP